MSDAPFEALVLEEQGGKVTARVREVTEADLPEGEVVVRVAYSDLNYKDGLIVKGLGKLVRSYPHVPGIDLAGTVEASTTPAFKAGDEVLLTGWWLGERRWGGFAQRARVKAEHLVALPQGLTAKDAMALGTAGFTAMLALMALENHGLVPGAENEVLVTGAGGGVGSVAVALLAHLGYRVAAATGRTEAEAYLRELGAATIVPRTDLTAPADRPLESERWAACIDAVGGATLGRVLGQIAYGGAVAAVGLAGGNKLGTTVIPFLLRAVSLLGIDSVACPGERRRRAWERLAREMPRDKLARMTRTASLAAVPALAGKILQGEIQGRTVIDLWP